MRAAQINEYGDVSVISVVDTDTPTVGKGQVLVKASASSLNPFDSMVRKGYVQEMAPLTFPATIGADFAGVVEAVGEEVDSFKPGDKVYGQSNAAFGGSGALAEYVAAKANSTALAPEGLSDDEVAVLPLAGVTAQQGIIDELKVQSGQSVLIHGGAGAVGIFAIQIAKQLGAQVTVTAAAENTELVHEQGADAVIDYKAQPITEVTEQFDAVFDTVGGEGINDLLPLVKKGGVIVSLVGQFDEAKAAELGVSAHTQMSHVTTNSLNQLSERVAAGVVKPVIAKVFPLEDVKDAFTMRETGSFAGKIAIHI